ncbi:MAG: gamma-D-glutamyl-L-lysine dipeptidyl-peptidase [Gaiellaceae bacterium]|nr:gamma-D-glutamyl-L-lysine dipeptidyl-peptidase [Gaiellaceae bacterium]
MLSAFAAALVLAATPAQTATVRVAVANVWKAPNAGHLPLDPHVWPTPAVTYAQRRALVGNMPTQVLYGESVRVLAKRSGWTQIAVPDQPSPLDARGYPGWVRSWQLGAAFAAPVIVTVRTAKLADGTEVGFATQVQAGAVPAAATRPLPRTRADIVRTAKMFLGLHYLWGGLSAWGYDCSGLTWAVYRAHGITIPRDADAQFAAGTPVSLAKLLPGDLLFYEHPIVGHVAMYLGGGQMIESPNSASEVRIVPVRTGDFRGARRFL